MGDTKSIFADAVASAMKMEVSMTASRALLFGVQRLVGDKYPAAFQTPLGEKFVMIALPTIMHTLCETVCAGVPGSQQVKSLAESAMAGATVQATQEAMEFVKPYFSQMLSELGAGGNPLSVLAAGK